MASADLNNCANCPVHNMGNLKKLGIDMSSFDFVVALAGNPNTGKSTVFNYLTGLRQQAKRLLVLRADLSSVRKNLSSLIYQEHIHFFLQVLMKKLHAILFYLGSRM